MSSFAQLKNSRKSDLEKLTIQLKKANSGQNNSSDDDRFWQPTVDKAGNGFAVIRFLPATDGEDVPFITFYDHGFQGPGGWYFEKSLTSIGQPDPISEHNSMLWNTKIESNVETARRQKRRKHFVSNIYVVSDPGNPANEGKVFLYKYGKRIFDKLNEAMKPPFDDKGRTPESPGYNPTNAFNPFDLWEGADFKLKIRKLDGQRNYDRSEFDTPNVLGGMSDDELENVWKKQYELQPFIDPKNYKSYDELKAKMEKVLGKQTVAPSSMNVEREEARPMKSVSPPWEGDTEDDDDTIAFFKKVASE